jgi:hypothetical protein
MTSTTPANISSPSTIVRNVHQWPLRSRSISRGLRSRRLMVATIIDTVSERIDKARAACGR